MVEQHGHPENTQIRRHVPGRTVKAIRTRLAQTPRAWSARKPRGPCTLTQPPDLQSAADNLLPCPLRSVRHVGNRGSGLSFVRTAPRRPPEPWTVEDKAALTQTLSQHEKLLAAFTRQDAAVKILQDLTLPDSAPSWPSCAPFAARPAGVRFPTGQTMRSRRLSPGQLGARCRAEFPGVRTSFSG